MADTKLSALTELATTPANDDEVYIRDVSEAAADESKRITITNLMAAAGGGDYPMKQILSGGTRWVLPGWYFEEHATEILDADRTYYIPIFVEETTTYIRIGIYVSTSSVGTADLRIFNFSSGVPDTLVLSAGTVNTGTTGEKEITISQELTRGYYYLAIRCTGTPILRGPLATSAISTPMAGAGSSLSNPLDRIVGRVVGAYDDPPPAPTNAEDVSFAVIKLREN